MVHTSVATTPPQSLPETNEQLLIIKQQNRDEKSTILSGKPATKLPFIDQSTIGAAPLLVAAIAINELTRRNISSETNQYTQQLEIVGTDNDLLGAALGVIEQYRHRKTTQQRRDELLQLLKRSNLATISTAHQQIVLVLNAFVVQRNDRHPSTSTPIPKEQLLVNDLGVILV